MLHSEYTRLRWICAVVGLLLYMVDIVTDLVLAVRYIINGDFVWAGLTLLFVLTGATATQIFSYAWHRDDLERGVIFGTPQSGLIGLHVLGMGIFTRFYDLLRKGFLAAWPRPCEGVADASERRETHLALFGLATDVNMLRLFETFLESVPQVLLQIYIMMEQNHASAFQSLCLAGSFANISWALVEYRIFLRRSLPHVSEMPSGLPTAVYLLYKLLTVTSRLLSLTLYLTLTTYTTIGLAVVWLLATIWTFRLQTDFCTSRTLEWFYRAVVGIILTFTFFNVKGRDTKAAMCVYYVCYSLVGLAAPVVLGLLRPEVRAAEFFCPVALGIVVGTAAGLVCLLLYYARLHPRGTSREADEVDGLEREPDNTRRMRRFLQP